MAVRRRKPELKTTHDGSGYCTDVKCDRPDVDGSPTHYHSPYSGELDDCTCPEAWRRSARVVVLGSCRTHRHLVPEEQ